MLKYNNPNLNKKMSEYIQNRCAYHPSQLLTNFCTCTECLLPVCPTCIKLHSEEHTNKNTSPQFQKIDIVFNQVNDSCRNIIKGLTRLKQQLLQVQKVKKQNESLILQKIKIYRTKIIRQFERALTDLEYTIVKTFQREDEKFIIEIQDIDRNITRIYNDIYQQKQRLVTDQGLKTVIFHLSRNVEIEYIKDITSINERVKDMLKKNIFLTVEQSAIDEIKKCIENYLNVGMIDWSLNNNNKNNEKSNQVTNNREQSEPRRLKQQMKHRNLNIQNLNQNNQKYSSRKRDKQTKIQKLVF